MRSLSQFTDASITDFLLSPLLVKKGDRPSLVRKLKPQHTSKSRAVITAAATVARKPFSPPANLPIIQGYVSFRLSSLPHPPAPSRCPLLFIRDPRFILVPSSCSVLLFIFYIRVVTSCSNAHSFLSKQKMVWNLRRQHHPSRHALVTTG